MEIPPAGGSSTDDYLRTAAVDQRPLPIFPLSSHLGQEKAVGEHFSHLKRHFPGRLRLRGWSDINHVLTWLFQLLSASTAEARWSCVGPVQTTDQTDSRDSSLLLDQLRSLWTMFNWRALSVKEATCGCAGTSSLMLWSFMGFFKSLATSKTPTLPSI